MKSQCICNYRNHIKGCTYRWRQGVWCTFRLLCAVKVTPTYNQAYGKDRDKSKHRKFALSFSPKSTSTSFIWWADALDAAVSCVPPSFSFNSPVVADASCCFVFFGILLVVDLRRFIFGGTLGAVVQLREDGWWNVERIYSYFIKFLELNHSTSRITQ